MECCRFRGKLPCADFGCKPEPLTAVPALQPNLGLFVFDCEPEPLMVVPAFQLNLELSLIALLATYYQQVSDLTSLLLLGKVSEVYLPTRPLV